MILRVERWQTTVGSLRISFFSVCGYGCACFFWFLKGIVVEMECYVCIYLYYTVGSFGSDSKL